MDDDEDPSVTAAAINVVCELSWRRPKDFLPLAPRLFDLLVGGGNNWMAIKIIKLVSLSLRKVRRWNVDRGTVCHSHTTRATSYQEAPTTIDQSDTNYPCNVLAV